MLDWGSLTGAANLARLAAAAQGVVLARGGDVVNYLPAVLAADATVDALCGGVVCTTLLSGADYFFNKRGVVANRAPPPRPARRRDRVRSKPRRYRR